MRSCFSPIFILLSFTLLSHCESCMMTVGKRGNVLPSFARPELIFKKAKFNCLEKSILLSENHQMKSFYANFNQHLKNFVAQTKINKMTHQQYIGNVRMLKDYYKVFYRNVTIYAPSCSKHASYRNMLSLLKRYQVILTFFNGIEQKQYKGEPTIHIIPHLLFLNPTSALGRSSCVDCMTSNFNGILNCTAKDFLYIPIVHHNPLVRERTSKPQKEKQGKMTIKVPKSAICG